MHLVCRVGAKDIKLILFPCNRAREVWNTLGVIIGGMALKSPNLAELVLTYLVAARTTSPRGRHSESSKIGHVNCGDYYKIWPSVKEVVCG